jgi:hypothetical protein
MRLENHGGMISTGETPDSSTRALWESYQQSASNKTGETDDVNYESWLMKYLFHALKGSLICRKNLSHGVDGFTSPLKEGVLRIFIALKIPSLSPGFEPANLGSNSKYVKY